MCALSAANAQQRIAYIYGSVSARGDIPANPGKEYHQMLLDDTDRTGTSIFRDTVENAGFQIDQYYDAETTLDASFLNQFDVIVFSLHQKIWSSSEKNALDTWLRNGGGMMIYSDSAAGGRGSSVGSDNTVGQTAVNNLISQYGMEVTVDQAETVPAGYYTSDTSPLNIDGLVFEGEGFSPVIVDSNSDVQVVLPYDEANWTGDGEGTTVKERVQNITIPEEDRLWACIALKNLGEGSIIATFDRQPMWNSGPGANINDADNKEIVLNIIEYLAEDRSPAEGNPSVEFSSSSTLELTEGYTSIYIEANASDAGGSIASVELFFDGFPIGGPDNVAPYVWDETVASSLVGLIPGSYELTLFATDDEGFTDSTTTTLTVNALSGNEPPSISFDVSSTLEQVEGYSTIYIKVNASDADGSIANVELLLDGDPIRLEKKDPYEWSEEDLELLGLQADVYDLTAIATDNEGGFAQALVQLTINSDGANTLPEVAFNEFSTLELTEGYTSVYIEADASDTDGTVDNVRLFLDDIPLTQVNAAPFNWDESTDASLLGLAPGTYELTLVATDNDQETSSAVVSLTVLPSDTGGGEPAIYEAEDATISKGSIISDTSASQGEFVDGARGFNITWTVQSSGGTKDLTFAIKVFKGDRSMGVFVNGIKDDEILNTNSKGWIEQTISTNLLNGINTIELRDTESSRELDVDYLKVTP